MGNELSKKYSNLKKLAEANISTNQDIIFGLIEKANDFENNIKELKEENKRLSQKCGEVPDPNVIQWFFCEKYQCKIMPSRCARRFRTATKNEYETTYTEKDIELIRDCLEKCDGCEIGRENNRIERSYT